MTDTVRDSIYEAIASIRLIDPHTHINPHAPASNTLADLLGYHYYTELAHSAGMPKHQIEEDGISDRELVRRLVTNLSPLENTAQYRWLIEICRKFFGFTGERLDDSNWEEVYETSEKQMKLAEWPQMVLDQSNVEAVFLTNDFDDDLEGFDSDTYIPCLRTDDLVFHLAKPQTRERLAACTGIELNGSLANLRDSLRQRFEHFVGRGARACAISLPPDFSPTRVSDGRATTALNDVLLNGVMSDAAHMTALSRSVFWTLAELCDEYGLPFDLMIGVNRGVYPDGVYQGQDLYDSRVSLIQYRELFNSFPQVKFPISVLASVTNQELVSYAWIFPNVITNGHWWYSNTPSFIARDAAARLEAVPQTKQISYYSDAYKLEFVWPKFDMYRQILSGILTEHFVKGNGWSEERAIELGRQVLRSNVDEIFPRPASPNKAGPTPTGSINNDPITPNDNPEVISIISDEELDPLPSHDEIQSANADDVQLFDDSVEQIQPATDALVSEVDPEPLDVGDVLGTDTEASTNPEIRMLRGEGSFEVDDESLLLRPDPNTGELRFPPADGDEEAASPE
ncbi:MAG TPA: glucuronate isomerase [Rhodopirellula sp.]|nr:glucuronate isomerase [Rhodopirellula sp.]